MKKYSKIIILIGLLIGLVFFVKSRHIPQSDFDLLVLLEQYDILIVCNNRLKAKQKDPNVSFRNVSYDNEEFYNSILSEYGDDLCSNPEKTNQVVKEYYKNYFKKEWKFIY